LFASAVWLWSSFFHRSDFAFVRGFRRLRSSGFELSAQFIERLEIKGLSTMFPRRET
jgi:hypothetical protein